MILIVEDVVKIYKDVLMLFRLITNLTEFYHFFQSLTHQLNMLFICIDFVLFCVVLCRQFTRLFSY
jgi:hypothetical protein